MDDQYRIEEEERGKLDSDHCSGRKCAVFGGCIARTAIRNTRFLPMRVQALAIAAMTLDTYSAYMSRAEQHSCATKDTKTLRMKRHSRLAVYTVLGGGFGRQYQRSREMPSASNRLSDATPCSGHLEPQMKAVTAIRSSPRPMRIHRAGG